MAKSNKTKEIIFEKKPPQTSYFVGVLQEVEEDKAEEYIKLGFAIDPEAVKKKASKK